MKINRRFCTQPRKARRDNRRRPRVSAALLVVLWLSFAVGCARISPAPEESRPGRETATFTAVRVQLPGEVTTLDPARAQTLAEREVASLLFANLVRLDGITLEPLPALAEKWSVSPDGLTYTFTLRQEARFAGGRAMTAADWKYSWERALHPATASPTAPAVLGNIAGADAYRSGTAPEISGLQAPDQYTLTVTLVSPDRDFPRRLAHPAAAVVDSWAVSGQEPDPGQPAGADVKPGAPGESGPYFLAEWVDSGHISLGKNQSYPLPLPQAPDRIEFRRQDDSFAAMVDLEAARLDLAQDLSPDDLGKLAADPFWTNNISFTHLLATKVLVLNPANRAVDDFLVRRAIFLALDREKLAASLGEMARPAAGLTPPAPGTGSGNISGADPGASRALLQQYTIARPAGVPALELGYTSGAENSLLARGVQDQLAAIGLKVRLSALPLEELRPRVADGSLALYLATANPVAPGTEVALLDQPLPALVPGRRGLAGPGDLPSPTGIPAGGQAATLTAIEQGYLIPLVYPRLPVITRPETPHLGIGPMGEIGADVYQPRQ